MSNMLIGFNNYSDDDAVAFSGGSWSLALTKLAGPVVTDRARSADLSLTNTQFKVDLGASRSIKLIALTHTNFTSAALYKITWYSDAFTTAVGNTGWLAVPGYPADDPDFIGAAVWHIFADAISYRYWKFEIDDNANADAYVEMGRLFMPEELNMSRNPDVNVPDEMIPNTPRQNALGGTGYFNRRKPVRKLTFGYDLLDDTDAPKIRRLRKICNLNKQIVIVPDPDDTSNFNDRNFVATLSSMPAIGLMAAGLVSGNGFDLIEVV